VQGVRAQPKTKIIGLALHRCASQRGRRHRSKTDWQCHMKESVTSVSVVEEGCGTVSVTVTVDISEFVCHFSRIVER
jgi:hypothetical protein